MRNKIMIYCTHVEQDAHTQGFTLILLVYFTATVRVQVKFSDYIN